MAIPERAPIGDVINGAVIKVGETHLLTTDTLPAGERIAAGELMVRYAVPYLGKPHLAIVPGLVALDYGDMLTGAEAWDFLHKRSNLHPRADVVGYRNDGADEMIAVKWLDLVQPVMVLAYTDAQAAQPIAQLSALIAADTAQIAPRLLEYLPHYPTLAEWQAAHDQRT